MIEVYERMGRIEVAVVSTRTVIDVASAYMLIEKLKLAIRDCEKPNTQMSNTAAGNASSEI